MTPSSSCGASSGVRSTEAETTKSSTPVTPTSPGSVTVVGGPPSVKDVCTRMEPTWVVFSTREGGVWTPAAGEHSNSSVCSRSSTPAAAGPRRVARMRGCRQPPCHRLSGAGISRAMRQRGIASALRLVVGRVSQAGDTLSTHAPRWVRVARHERVRAECGQKHRLRPRSRRGGVQQGRQGASGAQNTPAGAPHRLCTFPAKAPVASAHRRTHLSSPWFHRPAWSL